MCLICLRINSVPLPGFNFELFNLNAAPAINNSDVLCSQLKILNASIASNTPFERQIDDKKQIEIE